MRPVRRGRTASKAARSGGRITAGRAKSEARTESRKSGRGERSFMARIFRGDPEASVLRSPMLLLTLFLLLGAAGAGLWSGGYVSSGLAFLDSSSVAAGFTLDDVAIAGNHRTSDEAVHRALALQKGQSLFTADPQDVRARLMTLPWVVDAIVRRRFPDSISVTLIEKQPFAVWQNGPLLSVVERSGAIIPGQNSDDFATLPVLIGDGAPQAAAALIDALALQRATFARVRGIERVSLRRWDLILDRGVRVRLPETEWESELVELEHLIVDRGVLERDVEIIDLRYPGNYIFQLHNGDSRPIARERPA